MLVERPFPFHFFGFLLVFFFLLFSPFPYLTSDGSCQSLLKVSGKRHKYVYFAV